MILLLILLLPNQTSRNQFQRERYRKEGEKKEEIRSKRTGVVVVVAAAGAREGWGLKVYIYMPLVFVHCPNKSTNSAW